MSAPVSHPTLDAEGLAALVDGVDVIIWESGPEGNPFTYVSGGAERLLGYPRERWLEPDFWANEIVHPDDRSPTMNACSSATARDEDHVLEYRAIADDGRVVWLLDLVRLVRGPEGEFTGLRSVLVDVTAYKNASAR